MRANTDTRATPFHKPIVIAETGCTWTLANREEPWQLRAGVGGSPNDNSGGGTTASRCALVAVPGPQPRADIDRQHNPSPGSLGQRQRRYILPQLAGVNPATAERVISAPWPR
jgi:hypothetical protein